MLWGHKEQRAWSLVRHGLLANVSAGVLVAGNGSYILWPCGHDLHGLTETISRWP